MTNVKTDKALLEALKNASKQPLSADDVREQRVSFVMSALKEGSKVDRARVARLLAEMEGEKVDA